MIQDRHKRDPKTDVVEIGITFKAIVASSGSKTVQNQIQKEHWVCERYVVVFTKSVVDLGFIFGCSGNHRDAF